VSADDYSITYTLDADDLPVAQLFYRGDQWAEIIATDDGLKLMLFGQPSGQPPAFDFELAVDMLRGAGRHLDRLGGR
jgi:hypothetical protein